MPLSKILLLANLWNCSTDYLLGVEKEGKSFMKSNFTYEDYIAALEKVGPKMREAILERASQDKRIDILQLKVLVAYADGEV